MTLPSAINFLRINFFFSWMSRIWVTSFLTLLVINPFPFNSQASIRRLQHSRIYQLLGSIITRVHRPFKMFRGRLDVDKTSNQISYIWAICPTLSICCRYFRRHIHLVMFGLVKTGDWCAGLPITDLQFNACAGLSWTHVRLRLLIISIR